MAPDPSLRGKRHQQTGKQGLTMIRMTTAAITALLSMIAAQAQDGPYRSEQAARACIHKRLSELLAEEHRNIVGDTPLSACTNDLKTELKARGKAYCEAVGYIGWLVADENSKLNGLAGQPYLPDKSFLQNCEKSENWEKHR